MNTHTPRPAADVRALRRPLGRSDALVRAATTALVSVARRSRGSAAAYANDKEVDLVLRAATSPGSLDPGSWAAALASSAVADFLGGLGPDSAAAQLFELGLRTALGRASQVRVPAVVSAADAAAFVAELAPIPATELAIGGPILTPFKLATICAYTRNLASSSAFETLVRAALRESAALTLDAAVFSSAAADDTSPAGLLNGAAVVEPFPGGDDVSLVTDMTALAVAVAPIAGQNIAFVASPPQFAKLALRPPSAIPFPIFSSSALSAGTVAAFAPRAIVSAVDPVPEFSAAAEAVVHMADPAAEIVSDDPTVADPTRSLWQTDCIGLRMVLGVTWANRAPSGDAVAVCSGVSW